MALPNKWCKETVLQGSPPYGLWLRPGPIYVRSACPRIPRITDHTPRISRSDLALYGE